MNSLSSEMKADHILNNGSSKISASCSICPTTQTWQGVSEVVFVMCLKQDRFLYFAVSSGGKEKFPSAGGRKHTRGHWMESRGQGVRIFSANGEGTQSPAVTQHCIRHLLVDLIAILMRQKHAQAILSSGRENRADDIRRPDRLKFVDVEKMVEAVLDGNTISSVTCLLQTRDNQGPEQRCSIFSNGGCREVHQQNLSFIHQSFKLNGRARLADYVSKFSSLSIGTELVENRGDHHSQFTLWNFLKFILPESLGDGVIYILYSVLSEAPVRQQLRDGEQGDTGLGWLNNQSVEAVAEDVGHTRPPTRFPLAFKTDHQTGNHRGVIFLRHTVKGVQADRMLSVCCVEEDAIGQPVRGDTVCDFAGSISVGINKSASSSIVNVLNNEAFYQRTLSHSGRSNAVDVPPTISQAQSNIASMNQIRTESERILFRKIFHSSFQHASRRATFPIFEPGSPNCLITSLGL